MIVLLILELIIFVFSLINNSFNYYTVIFLILSFVGYYLANKGVKVAGTVGIVVGILMMLTILKADIVDFVLGLFVVIHSSKYNNSIK